MDRIDARARTGLLVGALAMALALGVGFVVSLAGPPFTPLALGQAIIDVLPGWISIPLIEALQFWAKGLLVAGVLALFLVAGALAGALAVSERRSGAAVAAAVGAPWVASVVLGQLFAGPRIDLAASVIGGAAGLGANALVLAFLAPAALEGAGPAVPSRRRVLALTAAAAAIVALGTLPATRLLASVGAALGNVPQAARRLVARAEIPAADPAIDAIAGVTPRITSNEDHYTVDTTLVKPRVDIATWRLDIGGNVERPYALTYDELLDLGAIEEPRTLECISNPVGGELVGTAVWTGVRLRDLLERAAPRANSHDAVLTSVDGYKDSIPLAVALDPGTLVAYLMNGRTVPQDHGYPVRVLVPDIYGMKNVKWLRDVQVATFDVQGYWQGQGWSDTAIVNTNTRIDLATTSIRWSGGAVPLAGIAFAGARGLRSVELSFDEGRTWHAAALEAPAGPLTWVRWKYAWTPPAPGPHTIWSRATDGRGDVETPVRREPYPAGATGYHTRSVTVVRVG